MRLLSASGSRGVHDVHRTQRSELCSDDLSLYVLDALDVMQSRSMRKNIIDWHEFRAAAGEDMRAIYTQLDAYAVIRRALERLGDNHSFFATPEDLQRIPAEPEQDHCRPKGQRLTECIGYIDVPAFSSFDDAIDGAFAQALQAEMHSLDSDTVRGWVVDLRNNPGGNMWPMLLGLGPLLGNGLLGSFVGPDGDILDWLASPESIACIPRGQTDYALTSENSLRLPDKPYTLRHQHPPVAVLTGPRTASSGEGVCVSFRGRPNSLSFGQPTAGLSTANEMISLRDDAALFLAVSVMADRNGRHYGAAIVPDRTVSPEPLAVDPIKHAAVEWLMTQVLT
jgi:C-terminal processing protease CtpA/Prc